ncbi:uncharacterized protein LOC143123507 isoform X2 [Alosa pseudoharengus]|uniref:uncharacterized protein LOC143123507 isoform X2 n=1 Tax=Alosa pseudoharengus TaxID=34774 RepID=UPI003F88DC8D
MKATLIIFFCLLPGVYPVETVISVTGYVGRSAVIRCPYDRGYVGHSKYLCRGSCRHLAFKDKIVKTEDGQTKAISGRFSLHDDTTAGVFTVTITGLTAGDSGQYWCGVKTGFGPKDVFSEVELKVQKGNNQVHPLTSPNSTPVPSTDDHTLSSPSTALTCNTSQTHHVLETNISGNAFKDQLTADEPRDVPEDSVVMVILCVLVLLVMVTVGGLVSALYYRQMRRKQTTACGPSSLHTSDHVEEPTDYETIELSSIPVTRASVSSLYCLAGAPHRPSVTSLCSTVKPATQGSDQPTYCNSQEDNVIYSNVISPEETTFPTMQYSNDIVPQLSTTANVPSTVVQNDKDKCIYSTAQFPKM